MTGCLCEAASSIHHVWQGMPWSSLFIIYSIIHPSVHPFIHPYAPSFIHACIHSCVHSFVHAYNHLFVHSLMYVYDIYSSKSRVHTMLRSSLYESVQWSGAKALGGFSSTLILGTSCLFPAMNARHCLQVQGQMLQAAASSSSGCRRGAGGTWLGAPLTEGGQLAGPCLQGMLGQMKPQNSGRKCLTWQVCRLRWHQGIK